MKSEYEHLGKEQGKHLSVFNFSARHRFVSCILLIVVLAIGCFVFLASNYRQAQNDIVALQRKDAKILEGILNPTFNPHRRETYDIEKIADLLDRHQNRVEALLETEYNKLQADFNILMLWASCLMIVFLVFSLYSIFKTEPTLKRGIF